MRRLCARALRPPYPRPPVTSATETARRIHPALIALLLIAAAIFAVRGPARAIAGGNSDLAIVYASIASWVDGLNPYNVVDAQVVWDDRDGGTRFAPLSRDPDLFLYPPSTFPVLAPVGVLPWPVAAIAWTLTNTLAGLISIWAVARVVGLQGNPRAVFIAVALAFAPLHTAIFTGQTILPVLALIALVHAIRVPRIDGRALPTWTPIAVGVMLGIATAIKPQVGLPFLAYELVMLRALPLAAGLFTALAITAIGVLRLESAGIDWLASWRANLESVQTGGQVTYTPGAQSRVHMVNLHPVMALVFSDAAAVRAAVLAVVAVIAAGAFAVWIRVRDEPREIGALSIGAALCMIIVYHRAYDASVLILPMAWCIQRLLAPRGSPRGQLAAAVSLALVLVYAVPGPATLGWLERTGRVPDAIASTWLWNNVLLIHHAWVMPVLACVLIWCLAANRPRRGRIPR